MFIIIIIIILLRKMENAKNVMIHVKLVINPITIKLVSVVGNLFIYMKIHV